MKQLPLVRKRLYWSADSLKSKRKRKSDFPVETQKLTSFYGQKKRKKSDALHTLRFGLPTNAHVFGLTDKCHSLRIVNFAKKITEDSFRKSTVRRFGA